MDTGEPSARGAGECARCRRRRRRPPPAGPDRPTRREGADSGGSASPTLALPPASPQLLPIALRPPPAAGPRSAAGGPPGSGLASPPRALCPPPRRSAGFWRPWVDAPGHEEEGAPQHAAEAVSESRVGPHVPGGLLSRPDWVCLPEGDARPAGPTGGPGVLMLRGCPPAGSEAAEGPAGHVRRGRRNTRPLFPFLEGE